MSLPLSVTFVALNVCSVGDVSWGSGPVTAIAGPPNPTTAAVAVKKASVALVVLRFMDAPCCWLTAPGMGHYPTEGHSRPSDQRFLGHASKVFLPK